VGPKPHFTWYDGKKKQARGEELRKRHSIFGMVVTTGCGSEKENNAWGLGEGFF